MNIDYDHSQNRHTISGPRAAIPLIFPDAKPQSLLDVGCGMGTWLKAAQESGIADVFGVDGIAIPPDRLLISRSCFRLQDLTRPWNLGRKFEVVLCLEVAEHLDEQFAGVLIDALVTHSDCVVFSAACPGQEGQHHVNCQWPDYWQGLFNDRGFVCADELRWRIWQDERVEPWYRQNIFIARRAEAGLAGREPRLKSAVHPDNIAGIVNTNIARHNHFVQAGGMPFKWYLKLPFSVLTGRLRRMVGTKKEG